MTTGNQTVRVNFSLSKQTIATIDRLWPSEQYKSRSAFLEEALRWHASHLQKNKLREQLKQGYLARAKRDTALVEEWEVASSELN